MKLLAAGLILITLNLINCNHHDELVALINLTADSINSFVGTAVELEAEIARRTKSYLGPYKQQEVDMFTITTCTKLTTRLISCEKFKRIINDELKSENKIIL